jgi:arylsulfatase
MEVFAAFLNYTDEQLGRLVSYLKKTGQYDNTLIVLLADNGASAEGGPDGQVNELHYVLSTQWPDTPTPEEYEMIGTNESHCNYPLGWAKLGNTPLKYYKSFTHAGGTRVPFIMSCPTLIKDKGGVRSQYHYVTDIFPTVLELCGIEHPDVIKGVKQAPKHGISMKYTLDDANAPRRRKIQYYETVGNRGIWCDGWKLVTNHVESPSFDEDIWELYNTDEDFSEVHDLAEKYPEKVRELLDLWWQEAEKYGVLPMLESLMKKRDGFVQVEMMRFKPQEKKTHLVLYPEASINAAVLRLVNKSFQITAKAYYRKGDEGVLFASGFNAGGYVLYIEDGKLQFTYNFLGSRQYDAFSDMEITEGEHEFTFDFVNTHPNIGVGRVLIDGKSSGKAVVIKERPLFAVGRGLGVGRYPQSSVCMNIAIRFIKYTGTIDRVDVEMDRPVDDMDMMLELEKELRHE